MRIILRLAVDGLHLEAVVKGGTVVGLGEVEHHGKDIGDLQSRAVKAKGAGRAAKTNRGCWVLQVEF